jgi:chorismate mutase
MSRLFALRGANEVAANDADAIRDATVELMQEILDRNALQPSDCVSCLFTLTPDLNAAFPAAYARTMGFEDVPLICAQEVPVPGALPSIVRVLVHYHGPDDAKPRHVYLGAAQALRADLQSAQ